MLGVCNYNVPVMSGTRSLGLFLSAFDVFDFGAARDFLSAGCSSTGVVLSALRLAMTREDGS